MNALSHFILYLSNLSPLLPIWGGRAQRGILWYYCWVSFLCDVAGYSVKRLGLSRHFHVNAFFVLEFVLIGCYLSGMMFKGVFRRQAYIGISMLAAGFIVHTVLIKPIQGNYFHGAIFYGIIIMLCIAALYTVIQDIEQVKIEESSLFVVAAAFLLYTSGSMVLLLFKLNLDSSHRELMNRIWDFRNLLNVLKNMAIAYIFAVQKRGTSLERPQ